MAQSGAKFIDDAPVIEQHQILRRLVGTADNDALMGPVHDQGALAAGHHDLADEAVGLAHQHRGQGPAIGKLEPELGAPDADAADRGIDEHGVRVGLGDHAADHRIDALHHIKRQRSFLGTGVINHFVQDHAAIAAHGEGGFIDQHDADSAVRAGFKDIALEQRQLQFDRHTAAVGAQNEGFAVDGADAANRLAKCRAGRGVGAGGHDLIQAGPGDQTPNHIAGNLGAIGGHKRAAAGPEVAFDNDRLTVRRGQ